MMEDAFLYLKEFFVEKGTSCASEKINLPRYSERLRIFFSEFFKNFFLCLTQKIPFIAPTLFHFFVVVFSLQICTQTLEFEIVNCWTAKYENE